MEIPRLPHQAYDLGPGVEQSRNARDVVASSPALRVIPNAVSWACLRVSLDASEKNSVSRGFAPGHPPST
jgi:hypothetical protein